MPVPVGCRCVMVGMAGRTPRTCEPKGVQGAPAAEHICMAHSSSRSHYSFHHHIESCQMRLWGVWLQAHGSVAQVWQEEGNEGWKSFKWLLLQYQSLEYV